MFYCDPCAERNNWPLTWSTSVGGCEVCGKQAKCNDVPSSKLPPAQAQQKDDDRE